MVVPDSSRQVAQIANYLFKQGRVVSGQPAAITEVEAAATPKAMKVRCAPE
jgi:malonyl CoA-acyl carrier protein transacylase